MTRPSRQRSPKLNVRQACLFTSGTPDLETSSEDWNRFSKSRKISGVPFLRFPHWNSVFGSSPEWNIKLDYERRQKPRGGGPVSSFHEWRNESKTMEFQWIWSKKRVQFASWNRNDPETEWRSWKREPGCTILSTSPSLGNEWETMIPFKLTIPFVV